MLRTVDMILGFTQLQIGDFNINPRKMDINQLLVNIEKQYREKAKQKGILFEFKPGGRSHIVKADENSILTVFAHLIDNAVKFTRKGKVSIIIEDTELSTLVYIKDTGIGMSLDFQQHLYEPYSQQSIGRSRDFEGLGLGLSIVKNC
ncbi:MAG: HAMP domain-containing histidine kinase [Ignavibacteriales bacterium]|nr:HAMP domain-containing histidine kinase [Ignavibacteriales bacterium]